jgi:glyoxylase-like metal-dependent hydrolase (beta-lactamase superfamily II)
MGETHRSMEPPAARSYTQKFGNYELIALSDGGLNYPAAMIFGNVPPEGKTHYNLPETRTFLPYTILLIKTQDNLLLVDVGAGELGNEGVKIFPGLDHRTSRTNLVVPSLETAGITPEDIDMILITHAHPDHIGGLHDAEGNLVFPRARYYIAQKEWEYWMSADPSVVEAQALRDILELLIREAREAFDHIKDRITFLQEGQELVPGVTIEPTYGHTPGHMVVSISAGDQKACNISDVVLHPLFVEHPEWAPAMDMDAAQADETRRRFFAEAADEHLLVFAHHLGPFPNLGRIATKGASWQWQPIKMTQ